MSRREGTEAVVIGAGVVGCAAAYYLSKEGVKTTIVERDSVASHASGFAFGGLSPLGGAGIPEPIGGLSLASQRLHNDLHVALQQEVGIDTQRQRHATITVAYSQEDAERLQAQLPWQQAQEGFQVEWKSGEEILAMERRLAPGLMGGVVVHSLTVLDPYRLTLALLQAAERMGATMHHGFARGLVMDGEMVQAVQVGNERIPCDAVVLAMGPWTGAASHWVGVDLPVAPLKGEILRLRASGAPLSYLSWRSGYAITKPDGLVWVGTTEELAGFDEAPSHSGREAIMASALKVLPYLADAELVRQTACLRPITPDGLPILGQVPGRPGVIVATGAGRKGIHLGPIMGRVVADLVVHGKTRYDIAALRPGRAMAPLAAAGHP